MIDTKQLASSTQKIDWNSVIGREVLATRIYFPTDKDKLDGDDELRLKELVNSMAPVLLQRGNEIALRCEGWADPRGAAAHNLDLSTRRCKSVIAFLEVQLQGSVHRAVYAVSGGGKGEASGAVPRSQHDAERRVDVFVKVTKQPQTVPRLVPPASIVMTPWAKRRASLFRTYSLDYHLWKKLGLDHLIDQYEQDDQADYPVPSIKPADQPKVWALLETLATPYDVARIRNWAKHGRADHVLAEAYCIEYRRAYDRAYGRSPSALIPY